MLDCRTLSQIFPGELLQILKENKDKKDAEFSERFKHRLFLYPPLAFVLVQNFCMCLGHPINSVNNKVMGDPSHQVKTALPGQILYVSNYFSMQSFSDSLVNVWSMVSLPVFEVRNTLRQV